MDCEGCLSLQYLKITRNVYCSIFQEPSNIEYEIIPELCPCRMCIIKTMCSVGCPEFKNFGGEHLRRLDD